MTKKDGHCQHLAHKTQDEEQTKQKNQQNIAQKTKN